MKPQEAIEIKEPVTPGPVAERPLFVEAEKLMERVEELTKSVAKRAYEFFEARGRAIGNEVEDWFRAESELLRRIPVTMKETENQITVQAEVPGFKASEINISAEPRQLMIEGRSEQAIEEKSKEEPEKVVFSERHVNRFCRTFSLPAEVDPAKVAATLKDGVLEITLPKLPAQQAVGVEIKTT